MEFPEDLNTYPLDTQYMFGSNLLVAPVFSDEGIVTFYVPRTPEEEGRKQWISWFDHGKKYEGGRWYTETHGFDTLPILIRPGSVTPINYKLEKPEGNPLDGLEILVNGSIDKEVEIEIVDPETTHKVLKVMTVSERETENGVEVIARLDGGDGNENSVKVNWVGLGME